jgi:SAM-dependent methyltransferase
MANGADFYDQESVFEDYTRRRSRPDNPNDTIEKPIFMEMLGDFSGKAVLDLGCGDGGFGVELLAGGCGSYTGVEPSRNMVAAAQENLNPVGGTVHHSLMEGWDYPETTFDLVVSRLAIHYVSDIETVFQQVYRSLKPGGRFVFSVEHPVITSSNRGATQTGIHYDWVVDDYFTTGERDVLWMGSHVIKYHRTIEDYFTCSQRVGFTVELLRESRPRPEMFTDDDLYARRMRIPLFLLLAATKTIRD